jgi:hypothetical protein
MYGGTNAESLSFLNLRQDAEVSLDATYALSRIGAPV